MQADLVVDAKGLSCPMPIVKAKKSIDTLSSGQVMQLEATDKGAVNDFQAWVKQTGNEMVHMDEENGVYRFFVKKA
ncbi:sulfurtransferase TusA family protein [Tumebacillus sp. ITR2]|uniref:Sulfurtransferase TusA family protein n=1 Tax=Tumebacillus amylolyticus TaxID=2801339 RepID=A0ABS1J5S4_9BACL|nr:sulfurtransferase TusA family protein [Tumebacillus amylolyticus]MBL0385613.1 sulfurtransferase TusA family protein [Tumebacillus amylolyticus]MBL0385629.1 sulfurtransferase TusA family protein [Tumebacillus amylolyticus]